MCTPGHFGRKLELRHLTNGCQSVCYAESIVVTSDKPPRSRSFGIGTQLERMAEDLQHRDRNPYKLKIPHFYKKALAHHRRRETLEDVVDLNDLVNPASS